jgi:NAD(P)H-quinone oxidoreductase subunit 5
VAQARLQGLSPSPAPLGVGAALLGALAGVTVVTGAALLWRIPEAELRALWGLAVVVCLALTPLLSARALRLGGIWPLAFVSGAFGVALAYFALHDVFSIWIDMPARNAPAAPVLVAVMLLCFVALFLVQTVIRARPSGAIARRMYPWFYAGLFLDELFTRITFRLWPARLSQKRNGVGAGSTTGAT